MPRIVAFDTSTTACSVALCSSKDVLPTDADFLCAHVIAPRRQAQLLLPMLENLLAEAGVVWHQIDAIAFTQGPGSFTGIRLASSVAQGIGFAANLPLTPISTLHAIAQTAHVDYGYTRVVSALGAPMGQWYYGLYQSNSMGIMTECNPETRGAMLEACRSLDAAWTLVGNEFQCSPSAIEPLSYCAEPIYPLAREVARLGLIDFERGLAIAPDQVSPRYLYGAEQWGKKP